MQCAFCMWLCLIQLSVDKLQRVFYQHIRTQILLIVFGVGVHHLQSQLGIFYQPANGIQAVAGLLIGTQLIHILQKIHNDEKVELPVKVDSESWQIVKNSYSPGEIIN